MASERCETTRIVIADDHSIVRAGIRAVISEEADFFVCDECSSGEDALASVRLHQPDMVIIDLMLGKESALPLIRRLLAIKPDLRVLVLSMHDESIYAMRSIKAGAHGYIMKGADMAALHVAIRTVAGGDLFVSDRMRSQLLHMAAGCAEVRSERWLESISQKEIAVLQMIGSGMPVAEIAGKLGRSQRTIEAHRNNIRLKLGLPTSAALVHYATQWVQAQD